MNRVSSRRTLTGRGSDLAGLEGGEGYWGE